MLAVDYTYGELATGAILFVGVALAVIYLGVAWYYRTPWRRK